MITLTIDNQTIQVPEGTTLLEAASRLGIHIPTLCFADGFKPATSCMVCVVRVDGFKALVPACGTKAAEGMVVTTCDEGIQKARRTAIELLLSDHVGDCVGPCRRGCPTGMDIPLMIRQIAAGRFAEAIKTVKTDIPLPAVLGRICSAPCEKICRRAQADGAVSICLLKRFVADADLAAETPYRPVCEPDTGKRVAIIGAGPCGLSAAYYLRQAGIDCTLFDAHEHPGGSLRYGDVDPQQLPPHVLEQEVDRILSLGIAFQPKSRVTPKSFEQMRRDYDAVLLAVGETGEAFGAAAKDGKLQVTRPEYATSLEAVFAAGRCTRSACLCVRAVADGKEAAGAILAYLPGGEKMAPKPYDHRMGRLEAEEISLFLKQASNQERMVPESPIDGFTAQQARLEALRCLHCDCRKADNCRLREAATLLQARQNAWPGSAVGFEQLTACGGLIYEPAKCIKCGLCVQMTHNAGESVGLAFEGRGFKMRIAASLQQSLDAALHKAAQACITLCPTGALSWNESET